MKLTINNQEIKFTYLEWSGSKYNAARRLEFGFPQNLANKIVQGDQVKLLDGKTTLFQGVVFRKERSFNNNEITILAYEHMVYLLHSSGSYNFKTTTLEGVVKKVCADLGLPVGTVTDSSTRITLDPQLSIGCYNVLYEACYEAKKVTGKVYIPVVIDNRISVIQAGEVVKNLTLSNGVNLLNTTYSETIENVVNKVIIVDENGKSIGQVTGEGLTTWGTFQDVYQKEEKKNPTGEAKKMLHGMDREASVEALGDTRCISGKALTIKDQKTGVTGLFYIDEDRHHFENGNHIMNLTLNYKNEMEEI